MRTVLILVVMSMTVTLLSANPRVEVKRGNQAAQDSLNDAALLHYMKALEQRADTSVVMYNLGNVMYQQEQFDKAEQSYIGSLGPDQDPREQSEALYNLGNSYFGGQKYDKAVAAYVEALKRNPLDDEARYNLELARRMLQQQKQEQKQDQQDKNEQKQDSSKQDQNQNSQDKQDSTRQDQQQQQQPQEQQDEQEQQQQQQAQPDKQMSKQEAERLLNALLSNEQNTLKDVKKVKVATRKKREKDW